MRELFELFEKVEATSKRKEKEELFKTFEDQTKLKLIIDFTYNTYRMFYIVKFDDGKIYNEDLPDFCEFIGMLETLSARIRTGHAARDLVRNTILCNDKLYVKWMTRIITKDLKIGIGIKTINKIFNNLIPTFELGVCDTFKFERNVTDKLPEGDFYIEPKFDGFRCAIFIKNGECKFLSRNNKPIFNTQLIEEEILSLGINDCMLDGEIMANDWNDTASIVMTEEEPHEKIDTLHFHCFDMLTNDEWLSKTSEVYLSRRLRIINALMNSTLKHIHLVNNQICPKDFKEALKIFDDFINKGYEGAILKKKESKYPFFEIRKDWIKWKEFITVDVLVKEVVTGTGKNKNRMGAAICDFNGVKVRVGGGFSDAERQEYWDNCSVILDKLIEIKAQAPTKKGSLRFGTFLRIRKDLN